MHIHCCPLALECSLNDVTTISPKFPRGRGNFSSISNFNCLKLWLILIFTFNKPQHRFLHGLNYRKLQNLKCLNSTCFHTLSHGRGRGGGYTTTMFHNKEENCLSCEYKIMGWLRKRIIK